MNQVNHKNLLQDDPAPAIAREGWVIVFFFFFVAITFSTAAILGAGWLGLILAVPLALVAGWSAWFFRDPPRLIPADPTAVICPADGVVCMITKVEPPAELGISPEAARGMTRVSVFMNVFNVHVNRSPIAGKLLRIAYTPGKFFNASLDKASIHNERCAYAMATPDGRPIVWVQIAGLIARRIVCRVKEGDELRPGERFGLIRFGSRVDVYLPQGVEPIVALNQKVAAGETVLARIPAIVPQVQVTAVTEPATAPASEASETT